jgi:DNA-binding MarR family transcriptional regulator
VRIRRRDRYQYLDTLPVVTEIAARPTTTDTGAGQRITYMVKRLEMAERARMEDLLRPLGVTLHQYTALSILERREGLSSAQLARRHFVTPQAMNQMIAVMERDDLIERRADPANRKILRAWLTDGGRQVLESCHMLVDALEERMLAALTAEQALMFRFAPERSLAALADVGGPHRPGVGE